MCVRGARGARGAPHSCCARVCVCAWCAWWKAARCGGIVFASIPARQQRRQRRRRRRPRIPPLAPSGDGRSPTPRRPPPMRPIGRVRCNVRPKGPCVHNAKREDKRVRICTRGARSACQRLCRWRRGHRRVLLHRSHFGKKCSRGMFQQHQRRLISKNDTSAIRDSTPTPNPRAAGAAQPPNPSTPQK